MSVLRAAPGLENVSVQYIDALNAKDEFVEFISKYASLLISLATCVVKAVC